MNGNDLINGSLEIFGAALLVGNCRLLCLHKRVRGVSVTPTAFFSVWGLWNLWFYPSCHLWFSFFGGICLAVVNLTWVGLAVHYSRRNTSTEPIAQEEFRISRYPGLLRPELTSFPTLAAYKELAELCCLHYTLAIVTPNELAFV